jgi:hypothetical protein
MSVAKLSVSLPDSLAGFVENYRRKRGLNRSQVFEEAVKLLRSREREAAYREADAETEGSGRTPSETDLPTRRGEIYYADCHGGLRDQQALASAHCE